MSKATTTIRLLFVDEGSYHHEEVKLPNDSLESYERLIDCLREDPEVLKRMYVDVSRLCAAHRLEG